VAARCSTRHRHWRHVGSCAAADEGGKTSGLRTSSSSLSPYASGDLQNNRKHKQAVDFNFFLCFQFVFLSLLLRFGSASLLVLPSSLFQATGWRMAFCRWLCRCWWPVCAKESWLIETGGMAMWCAARRWSVGTIEGWLKKEDMSAARSLVRTALLCSA